ncbi:hypothetical protein H6G57_17660 [Planktothrix sp. FACHB-1365]|nr:hypothetical protein [Planktothrix sp. FACHB-1365]
MLTTQLISRIPLPNDGKVVEIQPSHLLNKPKLNHLKIFSINGVVNYNEERKISRQLATTLPYPVKLISNGSLCQADDGNCSKSADYIKAFLNRFGNLLTGRGNESIIETTKNLLREQLRRKLPNIQLITYSEGGLIAHAAISDLDREGNFALKKITLILIGSPLHHQKIAELEAMVGKVVILNNPHDPVTCLQNDVFQWSSWFDPHSKLKQCMINSDPAQHSFELYLNQVVSTLENS